MYHKEDRDDTKENIGQSLENRKSFISLFDNTDTIQNLTKKYKQILEDKGILREYKKCNTYKPLQPQYFEEQKNRLRITHRKYRSEATRALKSRKNYRSYRNTKRLKSNINILYNNILMLLNKIWFHI